MSIAKVILSGLAAGFVALSGYVYYASNHAAKIVKEQPTVVAQVEEVAKEPELVEPSAPEPEIKPAETKEEILPRIFNEEPVKAKSLKASAPAKQVAQAPVTVTETPKKPSFAKKAGESVKKTVNKAVDGVVYALDNPQEVSLGKCSSSRSRYEDKECKWVRDLLADNMNVTRYRDEYRSKHGPEE